MTRIGLDQTSKISRFVVLGCGHTGTTLLSGILNINGYGSLSVTRLFESLELNNLNRRILAGSDETEATRLFIRKLERKTRGKWSLKDPRLCETFSGFYRHLHAPVKVILNFREPGATIRSLIMEREMHEKHLTPEEMQLSAEDEWIRRNRGALAFIDGENRSQLLITRYDDLVDRKLDDSLSRFVGHKLDLSFAEPGKRRSEPVPVSDTVLEIYRDLNQRFEANQAEVNRRYAPVAVDPVKGTRSLRTRVHLWANRGYNEMRSLLK